MFLLFRNLRVPVWRLEWLPELWNGLPNFHWDVCVVNGCHCQLSVVWLVSVPVSGLCHPPLRCEFCSFVFSYRSDVPFSLRSHVFVPNQCLEWLPKLRNSGGICLCNLHLEPRRCWFWPVHELPDTDAQLQPCTLRFAKNCFAFCNLDSYFLCPVTYTCQIGAWSGCPSCGVASETAAAFCSSSVGNSVAVSFCNNGCRSQTRSCNISPCGALHVSALFPL